jgi:hypothetical protein
MLSERKFLKQVDTGLVKKDFGEIKRTNQKRMIT